MAEAINKMSELKLYIYIECWGAEEFVGTIQNSIGS